MPYKVQKDGNQYCVHKENDDGSIGERVACHDTESKAESQVRALYASEADKSVEIEIEMDGEGEDETMTSGSKDPAVMGYRSFAQFVEMSWEEESRESLRYSHVREVFGDHIIVAAGYGVNAKMYKVMYTIDGEEAKFDMENMQRVELKTEWVAKSMLDHDPKVIKSIGDGRIGAFAVVWGNENRRDLDDQWFTKNTEGYLNVFKALGKLPWLFDHATDGKIKSTVVGEIDKMEIVDDVGIWYEAKILEHELYKKYISKLVKAKALYSSSGALPLSVKAAKTGEIVSWTIAEVSGTHRPSDRWQLEDGYTVDEIKAHYDKLGIDSTELFGDEVNDSTENQQDAAEAVDGNADRELAELAQEWLNLQRLQVNN